MRERGRVALLTASASEAESWLRRAAAVAPEDFQARFHLQEALRRQGKTEEADAQAVRAKQIQGRVERLGEVAQRRMSANPYDPALHCELGTLLIELGHQEIGRRWLLSALRHDPNYKPARAALAQLDRKQ